MFLGFVFRFFYIFLENIFTSHNTQSNLVNFIPPCIGNKTKNCNYFRHSLIGWRFEKNDSKIQCLDGKEGGGF